MIGIIGAMAIEIEPLAAMMDNKTEETISGITFTSGRIHGKDVVTAVCGVGKVFAAICAQTMIIRYSPDVIVNTGVAGAISKKLHIGDVAVANNVVQHDMDVRGLGYSLGFLCDLELTYIPCDEHAVSVIEKCLDSGGLNFLKGTIASGDQFISDREKKDFIRENFDAVACEMEGASIGHVCYVNKTPFSVIRAISDEADGGAGTDFPTFAKKAAENSLKTVSEFIKEF